ncbi:MAG: ferredoxin-thioredoxin reductase catalytic domain-containing protein [Promethearchaeota archaeon]
MSEKQNKKLRTKEDLEKVAKRMGWKLNPNEKVVNGNLRVQNRNIEKYGFPYCPCRPEKVPENICGEKGCVYAAQEIKEMGHCHCNLYWHPDYDGTNWAPIK